MRQRLVTLHSVLSRKREVLSDRPAKEYVTGEGYLVLHELCHLHEHDHSEAFYARLRRASPDYCVHDAWLRAHGDDYRL